MNYFDDQLISIHRDMNVRFKIESALIGGADAQIFLQVWRVHYPKCWESVCIWRLTKPPERLYLIYGNHLSKGHASFPGCSAPTDWSRAPKVQPFLLTQDNPDRHGHFTVTAPRCCLHCGWWSANRFLFSIFLSLPQVLIPKYSLKNLLYSNLCHRICCPSSATWSNNSFTLLITAIIIWVIPIQVLSAFDWCYIWANLMKYDFECWSAY